MRKLTLLLLVPCVAACTPLLPFHYAETAEVLDRGSVSLTAAIGGGTTNGIKDCCGGGAVRVRAGVGHNLEIGGELNAIGGSGSVALATKLSLKYAPIPYVALLAGLGVVGQIDTDQHTAGDPGVGADFGFVASTPLLARRLRVYGGARFSFVVPAAKDIYSAGGPTQGIMVPGGLSIEPHPRVRIFVEGGGLGGWSENRASGASVKTNGWYGGYGALAAAVVWGKTH
jgi:hypothetical protein